MEQAYQIMRGAIRVEKIRDGVSRSEQTELIGTIRLEQSGVDSSGRKLGISDRSKNIADRDKSCAKKEKKSLVKRTGQRVRKAVWSRAEQAV